MRKVRTPALDDAIILGSSVAVEYRDHASPVSISIREGYPSVDRAQALRPLAVVYTHATVAVVSKTRGGVAVSRPTWILQPQLTALHQPLFSDEESPRTARTGAKKSRPDASYGQLWRRPAFFIIPAWIIPPPRQTLLSYITTDCPGVTAHWGSANSTVQPSPSTRAIVHGASFWR